MKKLRYEDPVALSIEVSLEKIESLLQAEYPVTRRALGLLLLAEDLEAIAWVKEKEPLVLPHIKEIIDSTKQNYNHSLDYVITVRRRKEAEEIASKVFKERKIIKGSFREVFGSMLMHPLIGIPVLLLVLYYGLYKMVGEFGAGVLVDFLENTVFIKCVNPFIANIVIRLIPWRIVQDLFIGEYGIVTLGLRYAIAIILPIVTVFFFMFAIIEDTGYLPRLAMLIDRMFKRIGLSGRAVIPMVLGFGCDTMATMVTRTLPTKRERIIASLLLALAVPCSAQLGVILALLGGNPKAMWIWMAVITIVFTLIGFLTAKILPGERPNFYMEIPPLRLPNLRNVFVKTFSRVRWYLKEVIPLFALASVMIWAGHLFRVFDIIINILKPPVKWLGLPPDTATIFLYGFFRRDYGAAGLYDLNKGGLLTGTQLVVACVALTLFLPCIAQFLMNVRERGLRVGIGISVFVLIFSFSVAYILNVMLNKLAVIL